MFPVSEAAAGRLRLIAFYLPQYHPVPENDAWWGKGFTEWTNVVRGRPRFRGHYQPHLPADLGFYDLRLPEVREAQADLARRHGIHGFCYYHYWFGGRRILERPFTEVLRSGRPDLPFCLCWANENWTRSWDGGDREILLAQTHDREDEEAHIRSLLPALRDPRYIRIAGRPLLLVYRTELHPCPERLADTWRAVARREGIGEMCLARVESFTAHDPGQIGFDCAVEFAPDWRNVRKWARPPLPVRIVRELRLLPRVYRDSAVVPYDRLVNRMIAKPEPNYKWFRSVTPGFDNSARRPRRSVIFYGSTPEKYRAWLEEIAGQTLARSRGDERIIFVNAWNEWGEGNHLEPDQRFGHGYLEATHAALSTVGGEGHAKGIDPCLDSPASDDRRQGVEVLG